MVHSNGLDPEKITFPYDDHSDDRKFLSTKQRQNAQWDETVKN